MGDEDAANLRRKRVSVGDPEADLFLQGAGNPDNGILYALYGGLCAEPTGVVDKAGCVEAFTARTRDRVPLTDLDQGSILLPEDASGQHRGAADRQPAGDRQLSARVRLHPLALGRAPRQQRRSKVAPRGRGL